MGTLPRAAAIGAASDGFLSWTAGADTGELTQNFQRLTRAVGEAGCGWEMSLESWYRFLIDPFPYRELTKVPCPGSESLLPNCVQPATDTQGRIALDEALLRQRELFLRPDSLVAIMMLTDENDCSIEVGPQNWVALAINDSRPMFRSSSMCERTPITPAAIHVHSVHRRSAAPALDPICARVRPVEIGYRSRRTARTCVALTRSVALVSISSIRPQRYINALANPELCSESPSLDPEGCSAAAFVANPLYREGGRTPDDVFLAGIVGVPWQDLARQRGRPRQPTRRRRAALQERRRAHGRGLGPDLGRAAREPARTAR